MRGYEIFATMLLIYIALVCLCVAIAMLTGAYPTQCCN